MEFPSTGPQKYWGSRTALPRSSSGSTEGKAISLRGGRRLVEEREFPKKFLYHLLHKKSRFNPKLRWRRLFR
jgi:hypothetical protein